MKKYPYGVGARKYFTDPFDHERHHAWNLSKVQARFRQETWNITLEEYFAIWHDPRAWSQRGRAGDDLVLTRQDNTGAWHPDNVHIITRREQLRESRLSPTRKPQPQHYNSSKKTVLSK
jgi:hypothetical protein